VLIVREGSRLGAEVSVRNSDVNESIGRSVSKGLQNASRTLLQCMLVETLGKLAGSPS
jgi:hypothetical protein